MNEINHLIAAQLQRVIANLVRIGQIDAVDYEKARARVRIGTLVTDWLPWTTQSAGNDRDWSAPEVGEQVVLLSPSGAPELGVICGSLYQTAHPANAAAADLRRVTFGDGTVCEYDRAAHQLNVTVPLAGGKVNVTTAGEINLTAPEISLSAAAKISLSAPLISLNGNIVQDAGTGGTFTLKSSQITIEGPVVQTAGDLTSDGISLQHHTHGGVEPGGGNTATPN